MKHCLIMISFVLSACTHFGLDSEADVAAENCYVYRYGDKIRRINFAEAFDWCHRSANWGDANSQALLGELFYQGLGGPKDLEMAEQWYMKAARQGHAYAQFMIYKIYSVSFDREKLAQADYWLRQSAGSGYQFAVNELEQSQN